METQHITAGAITILAALTVALKIIEMMMNAKFPLMDSVLVGFAEKEKG